MGNGFFIDQSYLLKDLMDMLKEKIFQEFKKHHQP